MTESDQAGRGGRARRAVGRPAATETVDKPEAGNTETHTERTAAINVGAGSGTARGGATSRGTTTSPGTTGASRSSSDARSSSGSRTPSGTASRSGAAARKPRRARLRLTQVDAWTVMKTSFLLSIALGIVSVVAVAIVWLVLGAAGVFDSMNDTVQTLLGNDFRIQDYIGTGRILGFTMILAVVDVVLLTAIATLAAFLYNLSATLLGGVEVTLTEDS